jgi:hypothetical protein
VAPLAAQQQAQVSEFDSWRLPGWSFTPGVTIGALFDSNVAVAYPPSPGQAPASDKLLNVEPFGQLEFYGPRTMFSSGYHGTVRRYVVLNDLDGTDHSAFFSVRHMATRRVTIFTTENFLSVPTTDALQLNGVPFVRTGSRYNAFAGGLEARLSRTVDFDASYDNTWVNFDNKSVLLTDGFVNGLHSNLSRRFTERSSLGGEYSVRRADLNQGTQLLTYQEAGALYRYRTGPETTFEAAVGYAHLDDRSRGLMKDGPYVRIALTRRAERVTVSGTFERSYVPSFSFGGTNQSEELRGYVEMPLARNRFYVQEAAAWRRTTPLVGTELALDSVWANSIVGYALERWLRLQGYYQFTRQDTRIAAGQINRHIVGAQIVISDPLRIR